MEQTAAQQLRAIKQVIGQAVYLRPYQEVVNVQITDKSVMLAIRVFRYTETQAEVRFSASGIRMMGWELTDHGWKRKPLGLNGEIDLTIWDEDFKPYIECRYGTHRSVAEYYERLEWEANVHRPGTGRTPLDNFYRTVESSRDETTPAMYKYWTGHERDLGYTSESA